MAKKYSAEDILFFNRENFYRLCNKVSKQDDELKLIIRTHGFPPMWTRSNTFASLIHIILEQQVSLQSAKAAFLKLNQKLGQIKPEKLLALTDDEMRSCYFSRQKMGYARHLAETLISGQLNLRKLPGFTDDLIRTTLKQVKGIGDWTTDIYLLFALRRTDIFPLGDLAMVNALKEVKKLAKETTRENILEIGNSWRPYRSIATMLLWHHYIQTRNIRL